MRRCRYRGQSRAHIQHALTAIAVNIDRLSGQPPTQEAPSPVSPPPSRTTLTSARSPGRSPGEPWAPGNSKIPNRQAETTDLGQGSAIYSRSRQLYSGLDCLATSPCGGHSRRANGVVSPADSGVGGNSVEYDKGKR
ncbi:hypothetical protein ACIBL8_48140 [Streptomyces sp. NPDC050523]|uniref:hypothetical protein n=1 Tax=Streptomyces sp. NPDC050523 TaxID=3365622 RepID=UPI0037B9B8DF